MKELDKRWYLIFASALFCVGILFLGLSKNSEALLVIACFSFSGAFYLFGQATKKYYKYNLIQLDKKCNEMLKDISSKGEQSVYNGIITEESKPYVMQEFIKKNKKKYIIFYIASVALIIGGFILAI